MTPEDQQSDMPARAPSRGVLREWLRQLAADEISRTDAATRARPWIAERELEVADSLMWPALARLAGADIESAPGVYLYDKDDFDEWLATFDLAAGTDRGPSAAP